MKKSTLVSALQDRALTWYIKYNIDNPTSTLADIQPALNIEFTRPKFQAQTIVGFKEIMVNPGETPWD